jgi:peptidase A4-like protein
MSSTLRKAKGGAAIFAGPDSTTSFNWSGVLNTLPLSSYSSTQSFYSVTARFTVPVAEQAFSTTGSGTVCDGDSDFAANWVGMDGFGQADVLQGGTDSIATCNASTRGTSYYAWAEWYPAASIREFYVNPGDDMYVDVFSTSDRNGCVYLEDLTQRIGGT